MAWMLQRLKIEQLSREINWAETWAVVARWYSRLFSLPSGEARGKDTTKTRVLPEPKNRDFKNLLGYNLPVRPPLYKNLFSLKFETGSYFLKSIKTILYAWANKIANVQNPVSYHSNCNIIMACRFYIRKELEKKTLNTLEFNVFFSAENKNHIWEPT